MARVLVLGTTDSADVRCGPALIGPKWIELEPLFPNSAHVGRLTSRGALASIDVAECAHEQ